MDFLSVTAGVFQSNQQMTHIWRCVGVAVVDKLSGKEK